MNEVKVEHAGLETLSSDALAILKSAQEREVNALKAAEMATASRVLAVQTIAQLYGLTQEDSIDTATGVITRAPKLPNRVGNNGTEANNGAKAPKKRRAKA